MSTKRFFETVSVVAVDGGWSIELDGRPVRTPSGNLLMVPVQPLAVAMAGEWEAQGDKVQPALMPLCGLVNAAIDRVGAQRETFIGKIEEYCKHDMICYWADGPEDLVKRQHATWQPLIDWIATQCGAHFVSTSGIVNIDQPEDAIASVRQDVETFDDFKLTAFTDMATTLGSVIIALALIHGRLNVQQAFDAAFLDEIHQCELWGEDEEAAERRKELRAELESTVLFLSLF